VRIPKKPRRRSWIERLREIHQIEQDFGAKRLETIAALRIK
jgi:hypothetical protein